MLWNIQDSLENTESCCYNYKCYLTCISMYSHLIALAGTQYTLLSNSSANSTVKRVKKCSRGFCKYRKLSIQTGLTGKLFYSIGYCSYQDKPITRSAVLVLKRTRWSCAASPALRAIARPAWTRRRRWRRRRTRTRSWRSSERCSSAKRRKGPNEASPENRQSSQQRSKAELKLEIKTWNKLTRS